MASVPVLTDGVATLRAHHDGDIDRCVEQSLDPLSRRWTMVPTHYTRDDARRFVREIMPGGWATGQEWGFAVEVGGEYAGTVSLRDRGERRAEIAYGSHPAVRGTGAMERALRLLLDWGFSPGGRELLAVHWWAMAGNWASRKLAWRLGFSVDGTVRSALTEPDRDGGESRLVDGWVGTLLREDARLPRHPWLDAPRIEGEGIRLRRGRVEDVERAYEACTDERTGYWLGDLPAPYTRESAEEHLTQRQPEDMARGTAVHWVVADPVTDALLGAVSLLGLDSSAGAEVGYWAHPDARGRGVMTEAVRLAVRHAFVPDEDGGLGLARVRLVAAVDNTASRRVALASGFTEAGMERLATRCRDGLHDAVVHDLLPADLHRS